MGHVKPYPPDGNCAGGCQFPNPGTTSLVSLTGLSPGQSYDVSIQAESNGAFSAKLVVTQNLQPGQVEWKQVTNVEVRQS